MTSTYIFTSRFSDNGTDIEKDFENFNECVKFAAELWNLLDDERKALGIDIGLTAIIVTHKRTGYVLATLSPAQLEAIYNAVYTESEPGTYPQHRIFLKMGGEDYRTQAIKVLNVLADICIKQFNIPDENFPLPPGYLSTADAKRELQYLTEFCKIAAYQLQDAGKNW